MIECKSANVVGTTETINDLWKHKDAVIGFFTPEGFSYRFDASEKYKASHGIFWSMDSGEPQENILYHEQGHRIDHLLALRFINKPNVKFFTAACSVWNYSLDRQIDEINNETFPQFLHDEQRAFSRYIEDCKDVERPQESFAEINTHYCLRHKSIDSEDDLIRNYAEYDFPYLLPAYQKAIRPKAEVLAAELYARRKGFMPDPAI